MKQKLIVFLLLLLGLTNISFSQFAVNNDAVDLGGGYFRLTQAINNQAGSVWYKLQHNLNEPLNVQGQMYLGASDAGADGIAFVLQDNCLAAGSIGGGIGYKNMPGNSIAVEFDTYQNILGSGDQNNNDPAYDHLAILRSGNVDHAHANNLFGPIQIHNTKANVKDGIWYDFRINYDPATKDLRVFFDNNLRVTFNYDIVANIFGGDPYVYWGFTSSTGGFNNEHQIYIDAAASTFVLPNHTICTGSVTETLPPLSRYAGENMSLGKTAVSSSDEAPGTGPNNARDGNLGTRWSSQFSDPQWIYMDLGAASDIDSVILRWEGAYGSNYKIQTSNDASNWTDRFHETAGNGGIDKIYFTATNVRYVRMYGITRATGYGYSLWEFEIYGKPKYVWSPDNGTIDNIYSENPTFTPSVTTTYTVLIPDPCNGPTPYNMTITVDCSMPVQFQDFTVRRQNSSALLLWQTSSEVNTGYFEIQRSNDGINFTTIGYVQAAGNSNVLLSYSFIDEHPLDGTSYYRIMERDLNGSVNLSPVRSIHFSNGGIQILTESQTISIVSSSETDRLIRYEILTLKGQSLVKGNIQAEAGQRKYELKALNFADACYIIHIYTEGEYILEKLLLK